MTPFELLAILVTLAALLSWVNYRYIKLPPTIGLMVLALLGSVALVALGSAGASRDA